MGWIGPANCWCLTTLRISRSLIRGLRSPYFHATLKMIKPDIPNAAPIQSIFPPGSTGFSDGRRNHKMENTGRHIIVLRFNQYRILNIRDHCAYMMKNIQLQLRNCTITPARMLPRQPAIGALAPKNPRERFRILPGGHVIPIIATAFGIMSAPPIPDNARTILKAIKLSQKPLTSEQAVSQASPMSRIFLWLYTSPSLPLTRTNVP